MQAVVALLFATISLPPFVLLALLFIAQNFGLQGPLEAFGRFVMTALAYPSKEAPSQLSAILVSTLPSLVVAVCFEVDRSGATPRQTDNLNFLGKASAAGLLVGAISTLVLLVLFAVAAPLVNSLVGTDEPSVTNGAKLVVSGILSFQLIYIIKLLGLENVVGKPT
jgi:hypothetical protein